MPQPAGLHFYLASDNESKYLHAEVYSGEFSICNIDTEKGRFDVHFSADPRLNWSQESITIDLSEFIKTLEAAKEELLKFYNGINDPR